MKLKKIIVILISMFYTFGKPVNANNCLIPYQTNSIVACNKEPKFVSLASVEVQTRKNNIHSHNVLIYSRNVFKPDSSMIGYRPSVNDANLILAKEFSNLCFGMWNLILDTVQYGLSVTRDYIAFHLESSIERRQELLTYNKLVAQEKQYARDQKNFERAQAFRNFFGSLTQIGQSFWYHYFHSKVFNELKNSKDVIIQPNLFDSVIAFKKKVWPQPFTISLPWFTSKT